MKVVITRAFERSAKRFHRKQISLIEDVIDKIIKAPDIGDVKKGDLAGVRVYKFKLKAQQVLLAYLVNDDVLTLLSIGSHENFYRDLKR